MLITKTTHVEEALAALISQYQDQPIWIAVITAFANQIQEIEDALDVMRNLLDISAMSGLNLDRIGRILDEAREGNDDEQYRMYLTAKVLINKSNGTPDELMNIFYLLTGSDMIWRELYLDSADDYATARCTFTDALDTSVVDVDRLEKIAILAKPAGVSLHLSYFVPTPFTWDTADLGWDEGLWGSGI